jgi:oxygen-independent coproporphyrinogen-3 oxidase
MRKNSIIEMNEKRQIGLYLHIPFCVKKCHYCDFCSIIDLREKHIERYIEAMLEEINLLKAVLGNLTIDSVYIGGGTPSSIPAHYIEKLLNHVQSCFFVQKDSEVTLEVNPGTIDDKKLKTYKKNGINRISLGVQTFDERMLKTLGRIHTKTDIDDAFEKFQKHGYSNISIDLMFNLPGQSQEMVENDLKKVQTLRPKHVSYYALKVEEGTPFHEMLENGSLRLPDEEAERLAYHMMIKVLADMGYKQYEISNFAKSGFESKHNLKYWNREEYLGIGVAAHSFLNDQRFSNGQNVFEYIKKIGENKALAYDERIQIDEKEKAWEFLILGFRKTQGIRIYDLNKMIKGNEKYYNDRISMLIGEGLIIKEEGYYKLTPLGLDLSNRVFVELMP